MVWRVSSSVLVLVGQGFTNVPMPFAQPVYYGRGQRLAGLEEGDKVRISGPRRRRDPVHGDRGRSREDGLRPAAPIRHRQPLAIRTETILGKRILDVEPRGNKILQANGVCPIGQSTTPYQLYDAVFDVTKAAQGWDIDTVKRSLNVLSETVDQTYPASECGARRRRAVLRHHRQARRAVPAQLLAKRKSGRQRPGKPQRADQYTAAECADAAVRGQPARPGHRLPAAERLTGLAAVRGLDQRQPEPEPCSEQLARHQRHPGQAQERPGRCAHAGRRLHGASPKPSVRHRTLTLVVNLIPYQILSSRGSTPRSEARHRSRGVLATSACRRSSSRIRTGSVSPTLRPRRPTCWRAPRSSWSGCRSSPCSYTSTGRTPSPGNPLPCAGLTGDRTVAGWATRPTW